MFYSTSAAPCKPSTTLSSTFDWQRWWRHQSIADHTDWVSLITAAERVIRELRVLHVVPSS
jgi:hypothetical protein